MRLAILADDVELGEHVSQLMMEAGHQVRQVQSAGDMLKALRQEPFDLLLLSWTSPQASGIELLDWAREHLDPAPPAIVITERTDEADIVAALTCGADDYIIKPLQGEVLKARVNAVLRRVCGDRAKQNVECFSQYAFDIGQRTVTVAGKNVAVTAKEFALALLLFRNLNKSVSRGRIMETVWGDSDNTLSRTLDAHVSQIRKRLGLRLENGFDLSAVYGFGYRLRQKSTSAH